MKKRKIAFFEVKDWEIKYIKKQLKGYGLKFFYEELNSRNAVKVRDFDALSVFIYSKINAKILKELGKAKLIATRSTGFDHIEVSECKKRGITVCNVPFYGENTVAEHTFALILSLSRKIPQSYDRTERGDFSLEGLTGFDLKGKTIGIVGMGHIGQHVARIANGFEMKVLGFDMHKDQRLARKLRFRYTSFDNLLRKSDVVTLHVPYNKYTHHLINKKNIKLMKKGAILINTARGGLVDTDALVRALQKGQLGGAGLDVLEEESYIKEEKQLLSNKFDIKELQTLVKNHILLRQDNVIITPHNAFNSTEALFRILDTTLDNLKGFFKGKSKDIVS